MGEKIRAFIAISLPEPVLEVIARAQETLRGLGLNIRWVRKEGIHLTLKFLGDIQRDDVEKIHAAMEQATKAFSSFTLRGEGMGVFPDLKRPRVVWIGISGDVEALRALQRDLESQLNGLGFPKEKRTFKGHLTVGRVKGRLGRTKLSEALEAVRDFRTASFTAQSVVLFQSDLRPGGAVYSKLAEVPLKSA
ncbi:MAG: RNA 2',3'-cyclic phosphodiesterase [Deltaproteobacteria bacterium]|nr:RNA 2',3'-cyclic phosphodiesterase [Deltaproteobacteria bacterium]MBW2075205.1 RNA 2',3'-cyclic phosphodiesterase [Deltaproteobacteria bacterium]RLB81203.1 MAG: RNA 2',3'-cyclic phosphodiesterase [Deltaproteobacteria bacterium]